VRRVVIIEEMRIPSARRSRLAPRVAAE
jgi:hypothetical protein